MPPLVLMTAVALYDNIPGDPRELGFRAGTLLQVVREDAAGLPGARGEREPPAFACIANRSRERARDRERGRERDRGEIESERARERVVAVGRERKSR
jgi:hypothetical protein